MRKLLFTVMLCVLASPVWAADVTSAWVKQLALDGYEEITTSRTWLGRARIVAEKGNIEREIILNRRTGEILRDYTRLEDGSVGLPLGFEVELGDDHDEDELEDTNGNSDDISDNDGHNNDHEDSEDSEDGGESDESDEQDENDDD